MDRNSGSGGVLVAMIAVVLAWLGAWPATAKLPTPATPLPALVEPAAQCRESTNGCAICRVDLHGVKHCSLPGIACQPTGWRCITAEVTRTDSVLPR